MTKTWTLGASEAPASVTYDWSNIVNWVGTIVPGETDNVLIETGVGTPYTIYVDPAAIAVNVLDMTMNDANATLLLNERGAGMAVLDTLTFNAGIISLDDGVSFQVGGNSNLGAPDGSIIFGPNAVIIGDGVQASGGGLLVLGADGNSDGTLDFTAGGTLIAAAGASNTLEVVGRIIKGNLQIAGNAALALDSNVDPSSIVTFTGGNAATGVLIDNRVNGFPTESGNFAINVGGMDVGTGITALDRIDIAGVTGVVATLSGNVITVTKSGGTDTFTLTGNYAGDFVNTLDDGNGGTLVFLDSVCFESGTKIRTSDGDRAVESLQAGDLVAVLRDGEPSFQPVKWIGYRKLDLTKHPRARHAAPIRIARGAFGENLPARDLSVSPDHCLFLDNKLVPAKLLVNGMTIRQDLEVNFVTYYHVEMERHSILLAEGVAAESYLDTGNRAFFSNAGLALLLHPEFHVNAGLRCWATDACAPLAVSPAAVLPVWRPMADRAVALGYTPPTHATTTDADIHLVANGRRIDTIAVAGQVHSFMVPAGVKSLTLASRSIRPNTLTPYLDDGRDIGVAVHGVVIRGLIGRAEFSADHPALSRGWHAPERSNGFLWRQTTGNAALPVDAVDGPVVVEVTIGATTIYLIDDVESDARIAA
jgi:antigen 43